MKTDKQKVIGDFAEIVQTFSCRIFGFCLNPIGLKIILAVHLMFIDNLSIYSFTTVTSHNCTVNNLGLLLHFQHAIDFNSCPSPHARLPSIQWNCLTCGIPWSCTPWWISTRLLQCKQVVSV